jgi:hypothetical protein
LWDKEEEITIKNSKQMRGWGGMNHESKKQNKRDGGTKKRLSCIKKSTKGEGIMIKKQQKSNTTETVGHRRGNYEPKKQNKKEG